jgi:hypothetical protein
VWQEVSGHQPLHGEGRVSKTDEKVGWFGVSIMTGLFFFSIFNGFSRISHDRLFYKEGNIFIARFDTIFL